MREVDAKLPPPCAQHQTLLRASEGKSSVADAVATKIASRCIRIHSISIAFIESNSTVFLLVNLSRYLCYTFSYRVQA